MDCDIVDSRGRLACRRTELGAILAQTARVMHDTAPVRSQRNSPGLVLSLAQVLFFPLWWGTVYIHWGLTVSCPATPPSYTEYDRLCASCRREDAAIPERDPQVWPNAVEICALLVLNSWRIVMHKTVTMAVSPNQPERSLAFRGRRRLVFVFAYIVRRLSNRYLCDTVADTPVHHTGVNSFVAEVPSSVTWKRWSTARRAIQLQLPSSVQGLRLPECWGVCGVWVWTRCLSVKVTLQPVYLQLVSIIYDCQMEVAVLGSLLAIVPFTS